MLTRAVVVREASGAVCDHPRKLLMASERGVLGFAL